MAQDLPSHQNTFSRAFRLKRKRLIRPLFDRRREDVGTVSKGCIRIVYRLAEATDAGVITPLQIGFTTGRGIKNAVDRNRIKRYLRESFRLNQHGLTNVLADTSSKILTLMVIFRGDPTRARHQVPRHLPAALSRLASKIQEGSMP